MLRYLRPRDLSRDPALAHAMFSDRARQFADRMGWPVTVDGRGHERDVYDREDPVYVICQGAERGHLGSLRFLPMTGRTMLADHFAHLAPMGLPSGSRIWECTRFCLAPGAPAGTARLLLLGAAEFGAGQGLSHALGVFAWPMLRVYGRLGWRPEVLGRSGAIGLGRWAFTPETQLRLAVRAGIPPVRSSAWYAASGLAPALRSVAGGR